MHILMGQAWRPTPEPGQRPTPEPGQRPSLEANARPEAKPGGQRQTRGQQLKHAFSKIAQDRRDRSSVPTYAGTVKWFLCDPEKLPGRKSACVLYGPKSLRKQPMKIKFLETICFHGKCTLKPWLLRKNMYVQNDPWWKFNKMPWKSTLF